MSQLDSPTVPLGGPSLPQERRLVTPIPGPRSQELMARKAATGLEAYWSKPELRIATADLDVNVHRLGTVANATAAMKPSNGVPPSSSARVTYMDRTAVT